MMGSKQCAAIISRNWQQYQCSRKPTKEMYGLKVCGQHAKQIERWEREGRDVPGMVTFYWGIEAGLVEKP